MNMARVIRVGLVGVLIILVCASLYNILNTTDREEYARTHSNHSGPTGYTQLYSYREIYGFKGYQIVSGLYDADGGGNGGSTTTNSDGKSEGRRCHRQHGILTHILINILLRSGDVELNPGPARICNRPARIINRSNHIRPRCKKCSKCNSVTRYRRFHCNECGDLGKHMCPYCLTDELITHCNENKKIREYKCKTCIKTTDRTNENSLNERSSTSGPSLGGEATGAVTAHSGGEGATIPSCDYCLETFADDNNKESCNNCHHSFHSLCYKAISSDNNCRLCLLSELPFFNSDTIHDTIIKRNLVTAPSQMPDNIFECFKRMLTLYAPQCKINVP